MALQLIGLKAKLYAKKRHSEKVTLKRTLAEHSERDNKHAAEEAPKGAVPHYLLDREQACAPPDGAGGAGWSGIRTHHLNSASPRRHLPRCGHSTPLIGRDETSWRGGAGGGMPGCAVLTRRVARRRRAPRC